jgi:hypothetical protein
MTTGFSRCQGVQHGICKLRRRLWSRGLRHILWAGASAFIAVVLGLPLLILGPSVLLACPWTFASIGPIASGLLGSALGGLLLYAVLRSAFLSCARVLRSPGYPDRHWWFVRRAFRRVVRTELVLLAAVSGATVVATRSHGWLADRADFAVAVAAAVFVYYQLVRVAGLNDVLRHASVMLYFHTRVGDITMYGPGESLARHIDELDELARAHAVTPLSKFGWNDDLEGEQVAWHDSADGLKTVNSLLIALEQEETWWDDQVETIADLKALAHGLERADAKGISFSLLLRHSTVTSGVEWDAREGTCA